MSKKLIRFSRLSAIEYVNNFGGRIEPRSRGFVVYDANNKKIGKGTEKVSVAYSVSRGNNANSKDGS